MWHWLLWKSPASSSHWALSLFPSSSKCYGETVALASVPSSLLLVRLGFGSYLEGGGMLLHLLCSLFTVSHGCSLLAVGGLERLDFQWGTGVLLSYLKLMCQRTKARMGKALGGQDSQPDPEPRDWTNAAVVEVCNPPGFFQNNLQVLEQKLNNWLGFSQRGWCVGRWKLLQNYSP